jgi:DNA-directed RNA polymerase subunit RPC12/RpoP
VDDFRCFFAYGVRMTFLPNHEAPYLHWHVACAKCHKITLAVACTPPNAIALLEEDPGVRCTHCHHTQTYLRSVCFLAPLSAGAPALVPPKVAEQGKAGSTLAVMAAMIAAVRLARVESGELEKASPRVKAAIADSMTIAKQVMRAVMSSSQNFPR